jgi:hypothetical protein
MALQALTKPHTKSMQVKDAQAVASKVREKAVWRSSAYNYEEAHVESPDYKSSFIFNFADEDIVLAMKFENACNPVLRATARSILEDVHE